MKKKISVLILALSLACTLTSCGLQVPLPEVKTEEFDFSVTYEYNGEINTISGVYVCEYDGTDWALDGGYHREWTGYVKGDNPDDVIKIGVTEDGGVVELNLGFYPEYFMGDPAAGGREAPEPWISVTITDDEGMSILHGDALEEERYGVRIIRYEYAKPISNDFGILK